MISLQSHNQVLYHLTQLTSAFSPRPTYSMRAKSQKKAETSNNPEILCEDSLLEALRNCTELPLDKLNIRDVSEASGLVRRNAKTILNHINRVSRPLHDAHDGWRISYASAATFGDNKRGFSNCDRIFDRNFCEINVTVPTAGGILARGFKTNRGAVTESERNPPLTARFRAWIGFSKRDEEKPKKPLDRADLDSLRSLLDNTELPDEEKKRVQVAFAEGYLAGHDKKARFSMWLKILQQLVFFGLTVTVLISVFGVYKRSNGSVFRFQINNPTVVNPEDIQVTFDDVKGMQEAKQELQDIVEFLKNPEKFSALGGRLPKGVLLVGPPGTGKTLLARAVAGEARVPFFHTAGPEFDEVLVGQGARRVRDLFKAAKERAPCVIFIDEIDSVGAKRTSSIVHPYANQTINQLLTEMDGFQQNEGVIILGATNRKDDLDQALLRPGRFDVEVYVHKPDFKGRKEILELYLGKVLTRGVDAEELARTTTGFTGADLENLVNQAALRAAVEGAECVGMQHLLKAREKVLMGPELKGMMPDADENRITAYHEAGHALVALYSKDALPLFKVTIIPRSGSLGHTSSVPKKDVYHQTKSQLLAMMDVALGGRAAEELIFGPDQVTTGAGSDLQRATTLAESMVKNFGMSDKVGFRAEVDQRRSITGSNYPNYSPSTGEVIDGEVKRILQESYERAKNILKTHAKEHKLLAEALLKYESLDIDDVKAVINGKKPKVDAVTEPQPPIIDVQGNVM